MDRRAYKQQRALIESNIAALCRKFTVSEIEKHVLPIFRKATWSQVLYLLKKNKKSLSSSSIALVLVVMAKDEPRAFLEDMFFELFLTQKVVHSAKYTWNAFKMLGSEGKTDLVTSSQISEALKNSFRSLARPPRIKVKLFGSFSWIMIVLKKRMNADDKEFEQPFICAYAPSEPSLFASNKKIKTEISDGLLSTFGFRRLVDANLSASDIPSMITLLRNRAAKAFDAHSVQHTIAPDIEGPGVVTENGMDFTDEHLRINYANTVLGKDCPVLKKFTVKEAGPIVKNRQMYRTSVTIRTKNVIEFVKGWLVIGGFTLPLPPYMERILTLGKNNILIKSTDAETTNEASLLPK